MALDKPLPPLPATLAFRQGLPAFLAGPDFRIFGPVVQEQRAIDPLPLPSRADLGPPAAPLEHDPQAIFVLALQDLKNGKGVAAAKFVAWRFFAGDSPGKTLAGHVSERQPAGTWKLTSAYYGQSVSDALQASRSVESIPQVLAASFKLRILRIPGINVEAFWLVSTSGGSDLMVPFPSPPNQLHSKLNAKKVFVVSDFMSVVVPLASVRLAFPAAVGS